MKRGGVGGGKEEEGRRGEGGGDARKLGWQTDDKTRHRGVRQPGALIARLFGSPPRKFSLSDPPVRVGHGYKNRTSLKYSI